MWHARDADFRDERQSRVYPRLAGCADLENAEGGIATEKEMIIPDLSLLTDEEFQDRLIKMKGDHQLTLELCDKLGIYEKEEVRDTKVSLPVAMVDKEFTLSTEAFTDKSPVRSPDFVRKDFKASKMPSHSRKVKSADLSVPPLKAGFVTDDLEDEEKDIAEYKLKKYLDGLDYAKEIYRKTVVDKNGVAKHSCIDSVETILESNKNSSKLDKKDWKHRVTIPKPFQMTIRETSKGTMKTKAQESWEKEKERREQKEMEECQKKFKAAPLPANVYIPVYEELKKKRAKERHENHTTRREFLLSEQNPFTFIEREKKKQEEKHERLKHLKDAEQKRPDANFHAKPFPEKIFGDGVYEKMRDEEEMRLLRMDLRANEMLRSSSLPENMTKQRKKHVCPLSESAHSHYKSGGIDTKRASDSETKPERTIDHGSPRSPGAALRWPSTHLSASPLSRSFTDFIDDSVSLGSPGRTPRRKIHRGKDISSSVLKTGSFDFSSDDEFPDADFPRYTYKENDVYGHNNHYLMSDHFNKSYDRRSGSHYGIA